MLVEHWCGEIGAHFRTQCVGFMRVCDVPLASNEVAVVCRLLVCPLLLVPRNRQTESEGENGRAVRFARLDGQRYTFCKSCDFVTCDFGLVTVTYTTSCKL